MHRLAPTQAGTRQGVTRLVATRLAATRPAAIRQVAIKPAATRAQAQARPLAAAKKCLAAFQREAVLATSARSIPKHVHTWT